MKIECTREEWESLHDSIKLEYQTLMFKGPQYFKVKILDPTSRTVIFTIDGEFMDSIKE